MLDESKRGSNHYLYASDMISGTNILKGQQRDEVNDGANKLDEHLKGQQRDDANDGSNKSDEKGVYLQDGNSSGD